MAEDEKTENTPKDLMKFLSNDERPVSVPEFREFWQSLTDAEKAEFKNAKLD
jgi:hypothetical protein